MERKIQNWKETPGVRKIRLENSIDMRDRVKESEKVYQRKKVQFIEEEEND